MAGKKKPTIIMVKPEKVEVSQETIFRANKRMEWAIGFMIVRYHFVYQMLACMNKRCVPGMGTMGVAVRGGGQFELFFDPDFVLQLNDEGLTYVMYHEILHLALHHCTRRKFDLKLLGNIATDLAVNELIPTVAGSCMPPIIDGEISGMHVSEFKKKKEYADILEKQTSEWYYDYLMKKAKEQQDKNGGGSGEGGEDGDGNGQGKSFDDHGEWKEDEVADEKIRAKIDEIAKNNLWGDVGGSEKELILAAQVRRVNWRNILRQFYGNMIWHDREATRKRPNRRTGYIHPGERKLQVDRHLVAVDTSGSVDSGLLSEFLATINQMTDFVPIDLMQCDCGVTDIPKPFDRRQKEFTFKGRGGTSFDPIMKVVTERRYKSVVIFTDGEASEPPKPNARVVWVLPQGANMAWDWGLKVHMTRHS